MGPCHPRAQLRNEPAGGSGFPESTCPPCHPGLTGPSSCPEQGGSPGQAGALSHSQRPPCQFQLPELLSGREAAERDAAHLIALCIDSEPHLLQFVWGEGATTHGAGSPLCGPHLHCPLRASLSAPLSAAAGHLLYACMGSASIRSSRSAA